MIVAQSVLYETINAAPTVLRSPAFRETLGRSWG
jgi:hypothetical protein